MPANASHPFRNQIRPRSWLGASRLVLLLALLCPACFADDEADEVSPKDKQSKYSGQITQAKNNISWKRRELRWLLPDYENLGDWGKSDLRILTNDYARLIGSWQKVLDTFRKGDAEQGRILLRDVEKENLHRDWRKRWEARKRQSDLWPTEHWAEEVEARWGGSAARAFAPTWIEAKRNASMAWGRFAESITPERDSKDRIALEDAAHKADAQAKVAELTWSLREWEDRVFHDRKIGASLAAEKAEALKTLENKLAEISRQRIEVERQQRDWERQQTEWERLRKKLQDELATAYERATINARESRKAK